MSAEHFGGMLLDVLNFKCSVNWGNQWLCLFFSINSEQHGSLRERNRK
jgi:hypothetical protein